MIKRMLVIDTGIFCAASDFDHEFHDESAELLYSVYTKCHKVLIDEEGEIIKEYRAATARFRSEFFSKWITKMQARGKILVRRQSKATISIDPDDLKFIRVACNSPHRLILAFDTDYEKAQEAAKRELNITILNLNLALKLLQLGELPAPDD